MLLRCCSMVLCALTLAACVAPYRAARVDSGVKAIEDYNKIQADAQNRLLLINIQLVIGLQKDATDLPVSSAVNVLGGC